MVIRYTPKNASKDTDGLNVCKKSPHEQVEMLVHLYITGGHVALETPKRREALRSAGGQVGVDYLADKLIFEIGCVACMLFEFFE